MGCELRLHRIRIGRSAARRWLIGYADVSRSYDMSVKKSVFVFERLIPMTKLDLITASLDDRVCTCRLSGGHVG
jgi:hypothetical protein